jgi:hypothetical protein
VGHKRKLQKEAAVNAESWPLHDEPIGDLWKWLGYEMPLRMWVGHEERLAMQTLVSQKGAVTWLGLACGRGLLATS